mmetsp:Transcript_6991/g.15946  ORF Transcript_6991/g.15946 Transcript_6991/m.15946 type:complete len:252 (+) Transcript_6991:1156-1911(+)
MPVKAVTKVLPSGARRTSSRNVRDFPVPAGPVKKTFCLSMSTFRRSCSCFSESGGSISVVVVFAVEDWLRTGVGSGGREAVSVGTSLKQDLPFRGSSSLDAAFRTRLAAGGSVASAAFSSVAVVVVFVVEEEEGSAEAAAAGATALAAPSCASPSLSSSRTTSDSARSLFEAWPEEPGFDGCATALRAPHMEQVLSEKAFMKVQVLQVQAALLAGASDTRGRTAFLLVFLSVITTSLVDDGCLVVEEAVLS